MKASTWTLAPSLDLRWRGIFCPLHWEPELVHPLLPSSSGLWKACPAAALYPEALRRHGQDHEVPIGALKQSLLYCSISPKGQRCRISDCQQGCHWSAGCLMELGRVLWQPHMTCQDGRVTKTPTIQQPLDCATSHGSKPNSCLNIPCICF